MMLPAVSEKSELLWLAYLLTGDREISIDAVAEAADFDAANPFFRNWMISWSRKLVIARALGAVEPQMAASVERTRKRRFPKAQGLPASGWNLDPGLDKTELERALLAIDLFPRCSLLLRIFEKVSLDDAATLLNATKDQVKTAQAFGMADLTRNLYRGQAATSRSWSPCRILCLSAH